ncbi:hypothetical protein GCM10023321_50520 [Pseudonocardia eucalypti]|uniref:Uncharacterized protein n=1 Tax=Pseudonocardia eucalypti TaxID=648755 RepID=A0ABP9QKL6_9PSEU
MVFAPHRRHREVDNGLGGAGRVGGAADQIEQLVAVRREVAGDAVGDRDQPLAFLQHEGQRLQAVFRHHPAQQPLRLVAPAFVELGLVDRDDPVLGDAIDDAVAGGQHGGPIAAVRQRNDLDRGVGGCRVVVFRGAGDRHDPLVGHAHRELGLPVWGAERRRGGVQQRGGAELDGGVRAVARVCRVADAVTDRADEPTVLFAEQPAVLVVAALAAVGDHRAGPALARERQGGRVRVGGVGGAGDRCVDHSAAGQLHRQAGLGDSRPNLLELVATRLDLDEHQLDPAGHPSGVCGCQARRPGRVELGDPERCRVTDQPK